MCWPPIAERRENSDRCWRAEYGIGEKGRMRRRYDRESYGSAAVGTCGKGWHRVALRSDGLIHVQ